MSFQAVQAVAGAHHVHGAARAVLYVLANYADRGGSNAFPSQARIADESGFCDRTVRRALVWLEDRGMIRRIGGKRGRGSRGRAVVVWRLILALLKPDIVSGRSVHTTNKPTLNRLGKALRWGRSRRRRGIEPASTSWLDLGYQEGELLPSIPG